MSETKQILVVDDHFEMQDFLRSMLELSGRNYDVIAVPSAEEGWLELRRRSFSLMMTDLRLPGMSGLDLIRRARQLQGDLPVIMITAYGTPQGRQEARELGVLRYFEKPIVNTDDLMSAVQMALGETMVGIGQARPQVEPSVKDTLSNVAQRLAALRQETAALQILLIDGDGNILIEDGQDCGIELGPLAATLSHNLGNTSFVAEHLGGDDPSTIQYYAGAAVDLYVANIGTDYFVMVLFEGLSRRARIGTVWVFLQRAANDLLNLIAEAKAASQEKPYPASPRTASLGSLPTEKADPARHVVTSPLEDRFVPTAPLDAGRLEEMPLEELVAAEEAPEMVAEAEETAEMFGLDELDLFGDVPLDENAFDFDLGEALADDEVAEADDFWKEVVNKSDTGPLGKGLTLEEARAKGLFPSDDETAGD
ncbi:MAG: response regulator [Anaerolineales bacterium]|nr:response regulator [Anaerolineales bacterium]MCB8961494.1 response regulator [Ardenticatenales bacterium]